MVGVAHVSFSGGGLFLPARTPYDRQVLMEHVTNRVRSNGLVQVLVDDQRWMVHFRRGALAAWCASCGACLDSACRSTTSAGIAYCMACAFGGSTPVMPLQRAPARQVG